MRKLTKVIAFLIIALVLSGCASTVIGSYRGARIAEKGKWQTNNFYVYPDYIGADFYYGISRHVELGLGFFIPGITIEGKGLIFDERNAGDFMSLAAVTRINALLGFMPTIDMSIIAEKALWKYETDSISPISLYCGIEGKLVFMETILYFYPHSFYHEGMYYTDWWEEIETGPLPGRVFGGVEIPFGILNPMRIFVDYGNQQRLPDIVFITIEAGYMRPGNQWNLGVGLSIGKKPKS